MKEDFAIKSKKNSRFSLSQLFFTHYCHFVSFLLFLQFILIRKKFLFFNLFKMKSNPKKIKKKMINLFIAVEEIIMDN